MSERDNIVDARLARWAKATARIEPPAGFADRVMSAVERTRTVSAGLWEVGRVALVAFAVAAAVAVFWSSTAQRRLDQNTLSAFDAVELEQ